MKTIFFFFLCLALLATSCATQKTTVLTPDPSPMERGVAPPVYFSGNSEVAAWSVGSEAPECPLYYTGNNEPAASSLRTAKQEAIQKKL
jgi:hypothetical protein